MAIKFLTRLGEQRNELFVVARGEDRPNIIAEATGFLEKEGLYVSSIAFNLTSPEQDEFSMEIVAKGAERSVERCHLAFESGWNIGGKPEGLQRWAKIRWSRASMFHIGLNTPDRAGIVAAIAKIVGAAEGSSKAGAAANIVHLLGIIDNSGDSAQGGTPYFNLRGNVATETPKARDETIQRIKQAASKQLGFGDDLWIIPLDQPGR
jgi:predicted amino acid-binding ACT domain protein